jgi:hypothetical protein
LPSEWVLLAAASSGYEQSAISGVRSREAWPTTSGTLPSDKRVDSRAVFATRSGTSEGVFGTDVTMSVGLPAWSAILHEESSGTPARDGLFLGLTTNRRRVT